jgi:hypothetical protein
MTDSTGPQFIEDNLIVLSKQTLDAFLKCNNPADLIALYVFYYYTAKWQRTNQVKATESFVRKALAWGEVRYRTANKALTEKGLIEEIKSRDSRGKINGYYVKINYIWKRETLISDQKIQSPYYQGVDSPGTGKQGTNALSADNGNALSANKKMLTPNPSTVNDKKASEVISSNEFAERWNQFDSLPAIQSMNQTRIRQLKTRAKESEFADNWKSIIRKLSESDFHTGNNDRGWKATVDWILKNDTNYMKILEMPDRKSSIDNALGRKPKTAAEVEQLEKELGL